MSVPEPVLHVEDDAVVVRSLVRVLEHKGYQVVSAASCHEASDIGGTFRVGIFDVDLPDGDGVTLAEQLLQRGTVRSVVFYTGTSQHAVIERARRLGIVVRKAAELTALLAALGTPRTRSEFPEGPPLVGFHQSDRTKVNTG